jgi:hypothetical protein
LQILEQAFAFAVGWHTCRWRYPAYVVTTNDAIWKAQIQRLEDFELSFQVRGFGFAFGWEFEAIPNRILKNNH